MPARRKTSSHSGNDRGDLSATSDSDQRIAVGIIRKPHGLRGEASVEPWTDSPDRFSELQKVLLVSPDEAEARPSRIESTRPHAGRALVKFEGIDSPEQLQAVRNWTVEIPRAESRSLDDDEYFLHDLTGLAVVDATGLALGTIVDAYEGGGGILLTVKTLGGGSFDVPFASEICTQIDLVARRMVVLLPEGLDDLGAVPAVEEQTPGSKGRPHGSGGTDPKQGGGG